MCSCYPRLVACRICTNLPNINTHLLTLTVHRSDVSCKWGFAICRCSPKCASDEGWSLSHGFHFGSFSPSANPCAIPLLVPPPVCAFASANEIATWPFCQFRGSRAGQIDAVDLPGQLSDQYRRQRHMYFFFPVGLPGVDGAGEFHAWSSSLLFPCREVPEAAQEPRRDHAALLVARRQ